MGVSGKHGRQWQAWEAVASVGGSGKRGRQYLWGGLEVLDCHGTLFEAVFVGHFVALIVIKNVSDAPHVPLVLVDSIPSSHWLVVVETR